MNFLPATRAGTNQWTVAGQVVPGPRSTRDRIEFAIRPEDMQLGEGGIPATVRVVEPLGAHILVTTDVEGAMLRALVDSDLKVAPGDHLSLVPQPDRVRWFDPETLEAVR
jgi:multiple sugar transport system ATP-binding protein